MEAPLLKASYGLHSCSDSAVEEGSQPVFGLPFKFGRRLAFHRDLQPQHDNTQHTQQGISSSIHTQHGTRRAAASALHAQQERGRHKARPPKATECRCCQQQVPLGALASCLAQRGLSTAASAQALAAVAASAAAFEVVAAQAICEAAQQVPAPEQQHASNSAGVEAADADAGASCDQRAIGAAAAVRAGTAAASEGCRSSPSKPSQTVRFEAVSPGPGQYTLPPAVVGQGPAFTISARPAGQLCSSAKADGVPGPGAYAASIPGPAGPAFSLAGRWADAGQATAAPGPGEHQQLAFIPGGPAFSFLRRPCASAADKAGVGSPGPGAYGPGWDNPASPSGPAWSLGIRPRGGLGDGSSNPRQAAVPGPGAYHPDTCTYRADGPAYSFPAKTPADMSVPAAAAGPAPGHYDTSAAYSHTLAAAPAFSMPKAGSSMAAGVDQAVHQSPGPGAYFSTDPSTDPGGIGRDAPAFSMGGRQQQRQEGVPWESPGPGEYYREAATEGPAFSMAGRTPGAGSAGTSCRDTPGPGHYSLAGVAAGAAAGSAAAPAWTMPGRAGDAAAAAAAFKASQPGPGSYDVGVQGPQGPAFSVQGRPAASCRVQDATPGPLDYCPDPSPLLPAAHCYSIAGRPAASSAPAAWDSPGPGDYDVTGQPGSLCREGPAWTMGSKVAAVAVGGCDSPGPGAYHRPDLHSGSDGPAFTIAGKLPAAGTAADAAGMLPGPGQYEVPVVQAGAAFTMAGRLESVFEQQETTPGPGAFLAPDLPDPSSSSAPAFTIAGRPACPSSGLTASAAVPGPGAYQPAELPKGPAYSLAGRQVAGGQEAGGAAPPGLGAYEVAAGCSGAPAWSIGSKVSGTQAADADATPAPGDYHPLPDLPRGPAWTLAAKTALPGGAKEVGSSSSNSACEQPGPGYYTCPKAPEGLSVSFRRKLGPGAHGGASQVTPGPGNHHKDTSEAPAALATTTGRDLRQVCQERLAVVLCYGQAGVPASRAVGPAVSGWACEPPDGQVHSRHAHERDLGGRAQ